MGEQSGSPEGPQFRGYDIPVGAEIPRGLDGVLAAIEQRGLKEYADLYDLLTQDKPENTELIEAAYEYWQYSTSYMESSLEELERAGQRLDSAADHLMRAFIPMIQGYLQTVLDTQGSVDRQRHFSGVSRAMKKTLDVIADIMHERYDDVWDAYNVRKKFEEDDVPRRAYNYFCNYDPSKQGPLAL